MVHSRSSHATCIPPTRWPPRATDQAIVRDLLRELGEPRVSELLGVGRSVAVRGAAGLDIADGDRLIIESRLRSQPPRTAA